MVLVSSVEEDNLKENSGIVYACECCVLLLATPCEFLATLGSSLQATFILFFVIDFLLSQSLYTDEQRKKKNYKFCIRIFQIFRVPRPCPLNALCDLRENEFSNKFRQNTKIFLPRQSCVGKFCWPIEE